MAGCEKCWSDAGRIAFGSGRDKVDVYHDLIEERRATPCTPEEQCGELHVILDWHDGTRHCMCGKHTSDISPEADTQPGVQP